MLLILGLLRSLPSCRFKNIKNTIAQVGFGAVKYSFTFSCQASFLLCQASIRRMVFDVVSQSVMEKTATSPFLVNKNFQYSAFASNAHFNFKIEEENIYLFNDLE